ncbi:hypothetical protein PENTCL1PPCAC_5496, partial [Pristionchus entomophagus]
ECIRGSYHFKAKDGVTKLKRELPLSCTVKTCTRCGEVAALPGSANVPTLSQEGGCAKLTCPRDRIKLAALNATIAKPFCKEFEQGSGYFRWAIKYGSRREDRSFLAASCASSVNCQDVNPHNVICDTPACSQINGATKWSDRISCQSD